MLRLSLPAFALLVLVGCSGSVGSNIDPPAYGASSDIDAGSSSGPNGGSVAPPGTKDAGPNAIDGGGGSTGKPGGNDPGVGSGGSGGPGAGEHDVSLQGSSVAFHVPATLTKPTPVMILLHGQGDTGRNFLNVWLARGYPANVVLAAPDDNTDTFTAALETKMRSLFDVDTKREYLLGFSQGGAYAAFVLFDPNVANRFAAVGLISSGLAEDPSGIPAATPSSPSIAVVIDRNDPNNTWNQGLHVMEDFTTSMAQRGYDDKLWLHDAGHTISTPEVATAAQWMLGKAK
jgi:predicted esterase